MLVSRSCSLAMILVRIWRFGLKHYYRLQDSDCRKKFEWYWFQRAYFVFFVASGIAALHFEGHGGGRQNQSKRRYKGPWVLQSIVQFPKMKSSSRLNRSKGTWQYACHNRQSGRVCETEVPVDLLKIVSTSSKLMMMEHLLLLHCVFFLNLFWGYWSGSTKRRNSNLPPTTY